MATTYLYFGNAYCEYPTGPMVDWQTQVALRRRPEQDGANVGIAGKAPRPFSIMAILFGNTVAQVKYYWNRWEAERGQVKTIHTTEPSPLRGDGAVLLSVDPVTAIRRITSATNSANYMQWINLVFARVAETTPT